MIRKILGVLVIALLITANIYAGGAKEEVEKEGPDLIMEAATFHPPGTGDVAGLEYFKKIIEERSNGKIQVNVTFGKTLGGELDTMDQARLGTLHLVTDGMGTMGRYAKKWGVWSLPYAYPDKETLLKSVEGPIGKAIKDNFEKNGLVFVGLVPLGFRNMTANIKALEPENLKGLKLRLPKNQDWITVWEEFGAIPTPVPAPEMFLALQTGLVDAQENPYTAIHVRKLWEVQKYVILTEHVVDFHITVLSKAFLDKVSSDYREMILKAAQDMVAWQKDYVANELMAKYRAEAESMGMEILTPNKAAFRKIAMQSWAKLKKQWEPWVYEQLLKETGL